MNYRSFFYYLVIYTIFALLPESASASSKNILIIGGSKGIGKELVKSYSDEGYNVYATFHKTLPEANPKNVNFIAVNLLESGAIDKVRQFVKDVKFDTIIYNAGKFGYLSNRGPVLNRQDWLDSFIINSIAPIEIAFALKDSSIKTNGKYVAISSRRGSNSINIQEQYIGRYSYRSSKAALNSSLVALSLDLKAQSIGVFMLHPGRVATEMTKFQGMEPEKSAMLIKQTIDQLSMKDTGKFIDVDSKKELPW
jgi:NAD(P)-dependent dehydrogenase (short-subunit alcohol dehydrogenase family)